MVILSIAADINRFDFCKRLATLSGRFADTFSILNFSSVIEAECFR
jgi:hypothetical protein